MTILYILLGVLGLIALWVIFSYNSLVRLATRTKEAWADIDVQLKRRYDLIPNLIETVKGYAAHEKEVFDRVTQARAQAMTAQGPQKKGEAENMLTESLRSVFAIAEAYPQLRAVESFTNLQSELTDTENKIQAARRFYNGNVRDLNIAIDTFPTNLMARPMGFNKQEFFELEQDEAKEPVKVQF